MENKVAEVSRWVERSEELDELRESAKPGFNLAAPRFAGAPAPLERSFKETAWATLETGPSSIFFKKFSFDPNIEVDPDFDVTQYMRPQDYQFPVQYSLARNLEEAQALQKDQDHRQQVYETIAARPGASMLASLTDPVMVAMDFATFGLAEATVVPIIANTLGRTKTGMRAAEIARLSPRAARSSRLAVEGGIAGAMSVVGQEGVLHEVDVFHDYDDLGTKVFFGSLIGMALGGAVGVLGKAKTDELTGKFREGYKVSMEAADPAPFVGPPEPTPAERGILSTGKKPDIRLQGEEVAPAPKKSKEQVLEESQQLTKQVTEIDEPLRRNAYQNLRNQFKIIGESLVDGTGLPPLLTNIVKVISYPVRKMSATNRALSSPFGTARLYAIGMARNAVEFLGTRDSLILPRAAQNRIEDIGNRAMSMQLELFEIYMKANNITPSKFGTEKLMLSKRIIDESQFFEDVSTYMLHVGKPSAKNFTVNPYVAEAANKVFNDIYKPFGEILKEYKLIPEDADLNRTLNYLNRHWDTKKLVNDPKGFQDWLAEFYKGENQKLKSLMPNYLQQMKFANQFKRDAKRFENAAERIEKLKSKVGKGFEEKVQAINEEKETKRAGIEEKFEAQRDTVQRKYVELKSQEKAKAPDISTTKKLIKSEVKDIRKERDAVTKEYNDKIDVIKSNISEIKLNREMASKDIKSGKKDKFIIEQVKKRNQETFLESPEFKAETVDEIDAMDEEVSQSLDNQTIKQLRKDLIGEEKLLARMEIELQTDALKALKKEKKVALQSNKENLDKFVRESVDLLEEESKIAGSKSTEGKQERLIEVSRKLELKSIDLKEAHAIAEQERKINVKIAKLQEPIDTLEALQRRYSRAGLVAYAERKQVEQLAEHMRKGGGDEVKIQEMVKRAKQLERKKVEELPVKDEAQAMAEELREGYDLAIAKAEEMIPDSLRSTSTGKPYKTWDEAEHPRHANDLAEKTYWTMLGQEDEIITNPVLAGLGSAQSNLFKPRSLKMPDDYPGIQNWAERDARILINNFTSGIAPPIALTELMMELNKLPIVQQTVKRMQVLDPKIGAKRALDMPTEMQHFSELPAVMGTMLREEYRMMSEGLEGKELTKLTKEYQNAQKDIKNIEDQIKGIFANGGNVNSSTAADVIDLVNSATSTVINNNLAISNFGDLMTSTLRYGLKDYIQKGLMPLLNSAELRALSFAEMRAMNIAIKVGQGTIAKNRITGRQTSLKNSYLGRKISNFANRIGNYTGANAMGDLTEVATGVLVKTNILEMAEKVAKGTITEKELAHLAQRSTSPEQAKAIYDMWKRYGYQKGPTRGIDPKHLENPSPQDAKAFSDYMAFVNDEVRTVHARPGVGSNPNFSYTPFGKAVLFLKKWFMAATNDVFLPAAQRGDKEALQGFATIFSLGILQSRLRALYRQGEEKEFSLEGLIVEGLTNSALPGIYVFPLDAGLASGMIAGMGGARFDPMNGIPSLLTGPGVIGMSERTLNIMGRMRKILTEEDRHFNNKDLNYILSTGMPFYRWGPISATVKPNLKNYMDSIGRGEE